MVSATADWSVTYDGITKIYTFTIDGSPVLVNKDDFVINAAAWDPSLLRVTGTTLDWTKETSLGAASRADLITQIEDLSISQLAGKVYHSAVISISNFTLTPVPFDSEVVDDLGWHDTVTNNTRFTNNTGQTVDVQFGYNIRYDATAVTTAWFTAFFARNGATGAGVERWGQVTFPRAGAFPTFLANSASVIRLAPNDYVELYTNQITGGAINFGFADLAQANNVTYQILNTVQ